MQEIKEDEMSTHAVTREEANRVEEILDNVLGMAEVELRLAAELLVSKSNAEFFGDTEFQVREAMHRIGARLYDAALEERKKRGTADPASAVPNAARISSSRTTRGPRSPR
jgi:allophanate hydrolase subunit 2